MQGSVAEKALGARAGADTVEEKGIREREDREDFKRLVALCRKS